MALPQKVQAQLEQAETLLKQINTPADPANVDPASAPAPAVAPEPAPAPVENPAPAPAPEPAPAPAPQVSLEQLEQRYRSLQGMHRSMEQKVRETQAENAELRAALEQVRREAEKKPPAPALDPRDAEVFGSDLVEMVQRSANAAITSAMTHIEQRIAALEGQLQGASRTVAHTAESLFLTRLKDQVPDYEAVNADPAFLQWLGEEDPVYGTPRQAALDAAAQALDANRVAKVFLAFKKTVAPAAAPKTAKQVANSKLDQQLAPSTTAAPPVTTPDNQYVTTAQVQAFYDAVRAGRFRGREQEQAKQEAAINAALAQGRVVDRVPRM